MILKECSSVLTHTHPHTRETHTRIHTYTLAVRFFVHIPAGTYSGQLENTRNFRSIAKLLVRHALFWQLRSAHVYPSLPISAAVAVRCLCAHKSGVNKQTYTRFISRFTSPFSFPHLLLFSPLLPLPIFVCLPVLSSCIKEQVLHCYLGFGLVPRVKPIGCGVLLLFPESC